MNKDNLAIIPDTHWKPGVDLSYMEHIGKWIVDHKPATIIHMGDVNDHSSMSSWDVGKKTFEGRRYEDDVKASIEGMAYLMGPINEYNEKRRRNKEAQYLPAKHIVYGNHEDRIARYLESDPRMIGKISLKDFKYEEHGWVCHPFLEVITIEGIAFSHYYVSGAMLRPVSSARALLSKKHVSAVMAHTQVRDIAWDYNARGELVTALFAGTCYQHNEAYLGVQGNRAYRGTWILKNLNNGSFEAVPYTLDELRSSYS